VVTCSAIEKTGLSDIWDIIKTYKSITVNNGYYNHKRQQQAKYWMYETINTRLRDDFYNNPSIESQVQQFENDVLNDKISSFQAAKKLLEAYFNNPNNTKNKES
jgi:LAO/AO transport system kinase